MLAKPQERRAGEPTRLCEAGAPASDIMPRARIKASNLLRAKWGYRIHTCSASQSANRKLKQ